MPYRAGKCVIVIDFQTLRQNQIMEKNLLAGENDKAARSISIIRELLYDDSFKNNHRTASKFFSRKFKLDFVTVVLLILPKSIKPLQLVLNEFFKKLDNGVMVTKSAFTQARRHLKATAFVSEENVFAH